MSSTIADPTISSNEIETEEITKFDFSTSATTQSGPDETTVTDDSGQGLELVEIIGIVIGGVAVLTIIVLVICCCRKRNQSTRQEPKPMRPKSKKKWSKFWKRMTRTYNKPPPSRDEIVGISNTPQPSDIRYEPAPARTVVHNNYQDDPEDVIHGSVAEMTGTPHDRPPADPSKFDKNGYMIMVGGKLQKVPSSHGVEAASNQEHINLHDIVPTIERQRKDEPDYANTLNNSNNTYVNINDWTGGRKPNINSNTESNDPTYANQQGPTPLPNKPTPEGEHYYNTSGGDYYNSAPNLNLRH